ncbi:MAG: DNA-binding protein [Prevotella sp.]|nr:DNA-binding protein [Prevotella sp.]
MATKGTLKYKLYQDNRAESTNRGKWYARAVQDRTLEFDDFVQHMADHNTSFSRGTIHGVLMDMLDCLQHLVLDGKSVRLGELGLFKIGITTKPADTAKDFSAAKHVVGVKLYVRNTKTWANSELRKKCSISELEKNAVNTEDEG